MAYTDGLLNIHKYLIFGINNDFGFMRKPAHIKIALIRIGAKPIAMPALAFSLAAGDLAVCVVYRRGIAERLSGNHLQTLQRS